MATKKAAKPVKKMVKKPAKKKAAPKSKLTCRVCGLSLIVDKVCGCAEVHQLICCGQPMQAKKSA